MIGNMISIKKLNLEKPNGKGLLSGVSFDIPFNKITYLKGDNGIGKTTLLNALLDRYSHHNNGFERNELWREHFYLPQIENKEFLLPVTLGDIAPASSFLKITKLDTKWNGASGGERKRALLSKAFNSESNFLILDEPLNHMDNNGIQTFIDELGKYTMKNLHAVLISGHIHVEGIEHLVNEVDLNQWKS